MIKQDSLFLGQFDSLMKTNSPSSLSISQLFVAIEENKIPLISLNASQTVGIYEALINEINECLPIIKEVLASPAYIEVEIEKKVRRRCIFKRYKTVIDKIAKYDILENKMIADLIIKINWFIDVTLKSGVFEINTINRLFENCSKHEYGLDNFRSLNRLYGGRVMKDVLDVTNATIELKDLTINLQKDYKELKNNRFKKYLDSQNIAIENNRIIEYSTHYKKCYDLYNKLVALNCNKDFDKTRMTYLYREYILTILTYVLKKNNFNTKESADYLYKKDGNGIKLGNIEFYNDVFNVLIDNVKPMSVDLTFKIRNNVIINVMNDDLYDVVRKMNNPQITYREGKLITKDAVKGPLMRQFVDTCKELYGKKDKVELIKVYKYTYNALIG